MEIEPLSRCCVIAGNWRGSGIHVSYEGHGNIPSSWVPSRVGIDANEFETGVGVESCFFLKLAKGSVD